MHIEVTHASYTDAPDAPKRAVEFGAMKNGAVIWRAKAEELIARVRCGVRYFLQYDGKAVALELRPASALEEPRLRTSEDSMLHALLNHLPALPR